MPDRVYTLEIGAEAHQTTQTDASSASVTAGAIRLVVPSGTTQRKLWSTLHKLVEAVRRDPNKYAG